MKTIKPLSLSLLHRMVEHGGRNHFTVTAMLFVALDAPETPLLEIELWKTVAKELGEGVAFDEAMPKSYGEVLVTGSVYTPGGAPDVACDARVAIGDVDKTLRFIGDRVWNRDGTVSAPAPFTSMRISYASAFGGDGYALNPIGKGFAPLNTADGPMRPLPNIEDPRAPVRTQEDHPAPAGFGPYDFTWPQRASKLGTYDQRWLREDFPGFARDIDWTAFNTAPEDQRINGMFRGDEGFLLTNLHPTKPRIDGRLPGLCTRAFINRRVEGSERLEEVAMRLDTVHFLPDAMRAVLLFRGVVAVEEDDAADVLHLMLACERLGEPKSAEHYSTVFAQRTDRTLGARYAFREGDLMPSGLRSGFDALKDEAPSTHQGLLQANMRRRAEGELAKARAMLASQGIDPDGFMPRALPEPEPPPSLDALPEVLERAERLAVEKRAEAEAMRERAMTRAREMCSAQGIDFDAAVRNARSQGGGPPKPPIDLNSPMAALIEPPLRAKLVEAHAKMIEVYRKAAHHMPAAPAMEADRNARLRAYVSDATASARSLAATDLTGADLSSMHLASGDFHDALMESVKLTGSNLAGADLSGAVLVRSDLSRATLSGARFKGANLGAASLRDAIADEPIDLTDATFWGTDLTGASLRGATLSGSLVFETKLRDANLSGLRARGMTFMKCDLSGAKLHDADLSGCVFVECVVEGVDFTRAKLKGATFVQTRGSRAIFQHADAENLRIVHECDFAGADFEGARLGNATLRATPFVGAKFSRARLDASDLSECDLTGAQFEAASARDARFVRSNLTGATMRGAGLIGAIMQKANLHEADFTSAVLFGADMVRAKGKPRSLEGANVERVRVAGGVSHG